VLAGGRSTRFGGDKLAAIHRGIPLLHHVVLRLGEVCAEVVVILAPDQPEPALPIGVQARFVRDAREGEGPLAGLARGLEATSTELAFVAGGDMPDISTAVLLEMLRVAGEAPVDAVALQDGDRFRPLPSLVRVAPARDTTQAVWHAGERSLRSVLEALRIAVIDEPTWTALDPTRGTLNDVDEPADLTSPGTVGTARVVAAPHDPFQLGGIEVLTVCEGWAPLPLADELPGEDADWPLQRATHPWAFAGDKHWPWHVHAFLLRTPSGDVLVDTGVGAIGPIAPWAEGGEPGAWAGVDVALVRHVVLTHLHADHAGGAVSAAGSPRFPNARYHAHSADWEHFGSKPNGRSYSARMVLDGLEADGTLSLESDDHEVSPGVRVILTPGHTPGHRSVVLTAGGESLLLTGDLLHMPIQVAHPEWRSDHDVDPDTAAVSRVSVLARARDLGWHVAVSHFARPFGHVVPYGWSSKG
jgi:molybdopterin-guanine dinucleotide biosynthesis protein A/glyoxylase-like metal-dependent hydrolase (beta-lactamase superfamily II)